jgi:hypothetical protein
VEHTGELVRAQLRSASGRSSKVIKDRERVEVSVDVVGVGRLLLSVNSEGQYTLRASPQGEQVTTSSSGISTPLATGQIHAAASEPD